MTNNQLHIKNILLSLVIFSTLSFSGYSEARGTFPEITNPGKCITATGEPAMNIQSTAVLRKSQDVWNFIVEIVGADAAGTWTVDTTKSINNVVVYNPISTDSFAGGWAWTTAVVNKTDKGLITFSAKANNLTPNGISCTLNIAIKK
jgi:hypothetical protein